MIRGVDACRVIDRISVDASAGKCKRDPPALGYRQVGAFADDLCPDLVAIDAECIVGTVADLGVALVRGLDVSSDPAEPQKVDGRGQHPADQLGWCEVLRFEIEDALHLGGDRNGFGAALENAAP